MRTNNKSGLCLKFLTEIDSFKRNINKYYGKLTSFDKLRLISDTCLQRRVVFLRKECLKKAVKYIDENIYPLTIVGCVSATPTEIDIFRKRIVHS